MAGVPNATAFGATGPVCAAASASSDSQGQMPQPSGMMIGPSTTQCYVRPMQFNTLPQNYNQTPTEGQYGYGYYDPSNNCNYKGTYGEYRNVPLGGFHGQGQGYGASHANAQSVCCCFIGEATSPVNACGYDAGGVPLTFNALGHYDSPAAVAANSSCVWNGLVHAEAGVCQGQTAAYAQWLGLEGASRGLCIPTGVRSYMPNGFCVGPHGSCGACNMPHQGPINYPGCLQTFAHEFQELLNACGCSADNSDERINGLPNNFKCCGQGYSCFDNAFQAYWGTNYGTAPCAWNNAKTSTYQGGALIGAGNGPGLPGPGGPGPGPTVGPPCIHVLPGCITIHPQIIPQAKAATSDIQAGPGRKRMPKPQSTPNSPYPFAHGGYTCVNPYKMASGGSTTKRLDCSAHAAPAPVTPGPKICVPSPPICITIPNPVSPGAPSRGAIVPFVSASPAYPYRGTVCANQIQYPGGETWNFPLGQPEVPGGPGIPGPCTPPPTPPPPGNPGVGNPIVPITNNPGICGIQCINGTWVLIGPCGPLNNPICTGNPHSPGPGHGRDCNPCGPGCGPCQPCNPCQPNPCQPNPCGPGCNPCTPKPPCNPKSPFGCVSPYMPCYMGHSPWPSPQNVFGGALPQTPWLPGGKVDNGLGPSPAMPASPVYGPAPADSAAYQGPNIPAPVMPFGAPSSTTTTTTTGVPCTNGFPNFCQWNQRENCLMMNNNYTQGGNCVWGLAANLQAGNIAFPTHTTVCTTTSPGLAPVTPGQCGNAAAYPGSDKWVGTNPNPYITQPAAPAPCGPGPGCCGGDGDCDWDDMGLQNSALQQQQQSWHHGGGGGGTGSGQCYFQTNGSFTGPACFGGNQWNNQGVWGGWGNPYGSTGDQVEDPAESFIGQNWCSWIQSDAAKQGHGTPTTVTTQGAIPCWNPPNWNASTNPAFGNTSSPVGQGQFPSWPGQTNPGGGGPAPATGFYTPQATPFQNGDLYHPGFETVGSCFQGNPWQPTCMSLINPGAISMGLAGFQLPAGSPSTQTGSTGTTAPTTGTIAHQAHGGMEGKMVDVELSPGENVHMPCGEKTVVPGQAKYGGDTTKNDTYRTKLPSGAIVVPRTVSRDPNREARFVAAIRASKSPSQALRRANG